MNHGEGGRGRRRLTSKAVDGIVASKRRGENKIVSIRQDGGERGVDGVIASKKGGGRETMVEREQAREPSKTQTIKGEGGFKSN